jgi:aldehyde:ferredoxin oxidoreductase
LLKKVAQLCPPCHLELQCVWLEHFFHGGSAGYVQDVKAMLIAYYNHRGWDSETGKPSHTKLLELGLDDVARDLWG